MDPYWAAAMKTPLADEDVKRNFAAIVTLLRRDGKNGIGPGERKNKQRVGGHAKSALTSSSPPSKLEHWTTQTWAKFPQGESATRRQAPEHSKVASS